MVDKSGDLDALGDFRQAAYMIAMVVRDHGDVDLTNSGGFCGRFDAIGISPVESSPTGINQQRFARRIDRSVDWPPSTSMK